MALMDQLSAEIKKKTASYAEEKSAVPPRQCTEPQVHENDSQIEWIKLRIASSPSIFSRFGFNEEVIAEAEAYFESKDESFYEKGIEKLEKRWNECITLERNYVDE